MTILALAACASLAAAALSTAAVAITAADQTREAYVAAVEPICKRNTLANRRVLAGVRGQIRQGKLRLAGAKFLRASTAFGKAVAEIRAVPQPPGDVARLAKWLRALSEERELLRRIGKALKDDERRRAQKYSVALSHNENVANNAVLGFEFDYCLIEQSRFS